jgi:hypothetical protein
MSARPSVLPRAQQVVLDAPQVHHVQGWGRMTDVERLAFIRKIVLRRGRDPRIAKLCVDIFRKASVKPRDYKGQAAALLAWVQNPKNFYYVNEPAERLQDPIYSIRTKHGDCDDAAILLCTLFESVRLPWKLVLSGRDRYNGQKVRYVEGNRRNMSAAWTHIYCAVGTPPFAPKKWYFCEPTVQGVPLGWDVIDGDHSVLPEMAGIPEEVRDLAGTKSTGGSGVSAAISGAVAAEADNPESRLTNMAFGIAAGALTAIVSQIVVYEYRLWRDKKEEEKKKKSAEDKA